MSLMLLSTHSLFSQKTNEIDSLKLLLNKESSELFKGKLLQDLATIYTDNYQLNEALSVIDSSISIFKKLENNTLLARSYAKKGKIKVYSNQIDSGINFYLKSNELLKPYKDSSSIFSGYMYVAGLESAYQRDYIKAIKYTDTAELYLSNKDIKGKIYSCVVKGSIYLNLQDYQEALKVTNIGLKLSESYKTIYYSSLLTNKGIALDYSKDYNRAEQFYKQAIKNDLIEEKFKAISYYNLSQVKEVKQELDSALHYNHISMQMFAELDAKQEYFQSVLGQIEIFRKLNKIDSAKHYFAKINTELLNDYELIQYEGVRFLLDKTNTNALAVEAKLAEAQSNNYLDLSKTLSEQLYYYFKENGNSTKALKFLEVNKEVSDSILSQQEIIDIQKEEARIVIEGKNDAIHQKDKENITLMYSLKNQKLIIYLLILAALLLFLFVFYLRKNIKVKKQALVISKREVENEKMAKKISESNLNKAKELIQEKNKLIKSLEEESYSKVDIQEASEALVSKINTNKEWAQYMTEFEIIYPNFVKLVISNSIDQNLSNNEIRLLTLIKLNLSNKEIAEILFISADSVKKSKQRLVKKFNLQGNKKLSDYVLSV